MKRRGEWKEFWLWVIRATVAFIIAGSFAYILIQYREIAQALTPWATLLLALAAFWVIRQNYNFRRDDKQTKSVNAILSWAREGLNLVARINRLPTSHENFPPVWEVIACLSYIESQRYSLLKHAELFHNDNLKNTLNKALTEVRNCLDSYKQAEAMNRRLDTARKCEDIFVEVLNEASKITNT